ncbi:MAG: UbiA family prenyltransferase [Marinobacter sp.]|nr:UbiA family prenyltransferase [Marinobacter sp.]
MNAAALNLASPFGQRLLAWMNERFPFANALLFFILYLATAAVARATLEGSVSLSLYDLMGCLVTWSFFLLLRVFDEHKDYALDCLNHPQRVLQSGLITLNHLKALAALALALQLSWSLWLDGGLGQTTVAWLVMFGWTCLMGKEFFVADWLNRHLTWYAVSHMLVMPLIVWWLANLAVPGLSFSPPLGILMALAFVSGFCFEITRKTKGPEEERDTVESYSRIFGTRGSAMLVMGLVTAMVITQLWLIHSLTGHWPVWALVILAAFWVLGMHQLRQFLQAPSAKGREKNEAVVALTMLAGYAVLIAVVLTTQGVTLALL